MEQKLIHHFLEQSALKYPDKIALIHDDVRASYSHINNMADHLADRLIELEVSIGDRIPFILDNSLEYVVTYYGILKSGAVAVPLNTDLKPDSLIALLKELEPKILISSTRFERLLQATDLSVPGLNTIIINKPKLSWNSTGLKLFRFEDLVYDVLTVNREPLNHITPNPQLTTSNVQLTTINSSNSSNPINPSSPSTDAPASDLRPLSLTLSPAPCALSLAPSLSSDDVPLRPAPCALSLAPSLSSDDVPLRPAPCALNLAPSLSSDDVPLSHAPCALSLASIIYTSGSTGKPKGVMLSHGNIVANTSSICRYLALTEKDIQMVVLPFFYVMGKSLLNTHFAVGGTVVLNNKFAYPATVLKQMVDEHVTGFSGVPSTYAYLLHRSPLAAYRDRLDSLRYCSQAGGHMAKQIKKELRNVLPEHTKIYIMYGATEASARLTYLDPDKYEAKMDSIGRAIPGVVMKVLNADGKEAGVGEEGELVGAGPNIMQGYFRDEETTKKVLDHNGYHTGDMGYMDEDGYLYATGRKDGLLKVGGHRINIQEVEDVLMETELLIETAVLGIKDELLGNKLKAVAVPVDGDCSENLLLRRCSEKLPAYKLPAEIKFVQSLPKSMSGKIDRSKCLLLFG